MGSLFTHLRDRDRLVVGGATFDHGSELSPEALRAIPKAARRIRAASAARSST